ncbi:MAG: hypothetical protein IKP12_02660 [Acholeplasmatales bacterium]|nr:hypothetical protein [Acholeplasmatales bacterium]
MYRIDYEIEGNRLYIDARDFLTLLAGIPSLEIVDGESINLVKEIVSSLIATSEDVELEQQYLKVQDKDIINIYERLKKEAQKKLKDEKSKSKLSSNNTIE